MQALLYLIWISLPIILFVFAALYFVVEKTIFRGQLEEDRKSGTIFVAARLVLFASVITLALDHFLLAKGYFVSPRSPIFVQVRWCLFPASIILTIFLASIRNILKPKRAFDKLKMEARGANPIFTLIATGLFFTLLLQGPDQEVAKQTTYEDAGDLAEAALDKGKQIATQSSASASKSANSNNTSGGALARWLDEFLNLLGLKSGEADRSSGPILILPVFNQEGFLMFRDRLVSLARENGLEPELLLAIVEIGSGYNTSWQDPNGARGLIPLKEDVARSYGVKNLQSIEQNLRAGTKYIQDLLEHYGGDVALAVGAFRLGQEDYPSEAQLKSSSEVSKYVDKVMTVYEISKARKG